MLVDLRLICEISPSTHKYPSRSIQSFRVAESLETGHGESVELTFEPQVSPCGDDEPEAAVAFFASVSLTSSRYR